MHRFSSNVHLTSGISIEQAVSLFDENLSEGLEKSSSVSAQNIGDEAKVPTFGGSSTRMIIRFSKEPLKTSAFSAYHIAGNRFGNLNSRLRVVEAIRAVFLESYVAFSSLRLTGTLSDILLPF